MVPKVTSTVASSLEPTDAVTDGPADDSSFGTFDDEGNYTPREIVSDDLGMSFADAIDGTIVDVEDGQMVNGTVVKIDKDEVLLDIGYKSEGAIPGNEFDDIKEVKEGDEIDVLIERLEDREGMVVLSKERADLMKAWDEISQAVEADEVVEGVIIARLSHLLFNNPSNNNNNNST